jgi:hypothetical protein
MGPLVPWFGYPKNQACALKSSDSCALYDEIFDTLDTPPHSDKDLNMAGCRQLHCQRLPGPVTRRPTKIAVLATFTTRPGSESQTEVTQLVSF